MILEQIPAGSRLAVDANILVYHYTGRSVQCSEFLLRCQAGELQALLPAHIALEVLHRLMTIEAGTTAQKLQERPTVVQTLSRCQTDFARLPQLGLQLVSTDASSLSRVPWFCATFGVLANDAGLLAVMETQAIRALATADRQFRDLDVCDAYWPDDLA